MKTIYLLLGLTVLPTIWLCCRQNIGQENLKELLVEWKKLRPPEISSIMPLDKKHDDKSASPALIDNKKMCKPSPVEDVVFNYIYKKLDLVDIFSAICLSLSLDQETPEQCDEVFTSCLNNIANASVMKIKIKANKKNIKKLIKASSVSLETSMSAFIVLGQALQLMSNLRCDDDPLEIARIKTEFEQKIHEQYGDEKRAIYNLFEVLFEYAMDSGFFGK
jgi:hypothetical protein